MFDPFMGSGTTAIACINTKRIYIVGEIDKTYFDKSVERIESHLEENK
ncbi:DNA methyltransferase [Mycoplasma sp. CSL7491-lung]|nr:DNA methyltransferase [Mycoplasma sp. CSL7491-lung]